MKKPFVTKAQVEDIVKKYPTPFYIYDEKGIIENAKAVYDAFSWNKGFKEYFAVKATPNPILMQILKEQGCGFDCSSLTELMLSKALDAKGSDIMFSSNDTPAEEFVYANKIGAIINLDDFTHIDFLEKAGMKLWQVLPLGPTGYGDSPYQSFSTFALNPLLIDFDDVIGAFFKKVFNPKYSQSNSLSNFPRWKIPNPY